MVGLTTRVSLFPTAICETTFCNASHLSSKQEEADTKLILHAVDAALWGATHIDTHADDTDVLVLALRRAKMMAPQD